MLLLRIVIVLALSPPFFATQHPTPVRAPAALRPNQGPVGVVYVDAAANGANDGTTWDDAFTDLQSALAVAGEVWIAEGTYTPGPPGDRHATFQLVSGLRVYGGFGGFESSLAQRDVAAHPTVLSGDIDGDDTFGVGSGWWQLGWSGNLGNSYHVVTGSGADASAVLDGVTIVAGRGDGPVPGGAGLLVEGGDPTIRGCTFRYHAVGYGASVRLSDCQSLFDDCVIADGYTCNCGLGGWTSGVLLLEQSNVTFTGCEFSNHYYVSSQDQGRGAALSVDFDCAATVVDCVFAGNQTGNFYPIGGGTAYGAAIFAAGDIFVDRCAFVDNFAHAGAGLTAWSNAVVTNSLFANNEVVSHPNSFGFDDGGYAGGLLTLGFGQHSIEISNCTFVDNNADKGGGLAIYGASTATLRNIIAYGNFADPPEPGEGEVFILKQQLVGSYDIESSCVEGLLQTEPGEDPPDPANFPGCIDVAPGFVDAELGDYRLAPASACVDAGDSGAVPIHSVLDLDGTARFADDPATVDTGSGPHPIVDIGCYERKP